MPFETDKDKGFKIDLSELIKTGVYPERFDRSIPFWETVNGVQYNEFGMKRKAGRQLIYTTEVEGDEDLINDVVKIESTFSAQLYQPPPSVLQIQHKIFFNGVKNFQPGDQINITGVPNPSPDAGTTLPPDPPGGDTWTQDMRDIYEINGVQTIVAAVYSGSVPAGQSAFVFYSITGSYDDNGNQTGPLIRPDPLAPPMWMGDPVSPAGGTTQFNISSAGVFAVGDAIPPGVRTPIRGITSVIENDDKFAYFGDLNQIYSYSLKTNSSDIVGFNYSLFATSSGTQWIDNPGVNAVTTTWLDSVSGENVLTVWDEGINEADQWDFETFGNWVVGAYGSSKPVIKKNGTTFNTFFKDNISGADIVINIPSQLGENWSVGDTGFIDPTASQTALSLTFTVTEIGTFQSYTNRPTKIKVNNWGSVVNPANPNAPYYATGNVYTARPINTVNSNVTNFGIRITIPDINFTKLKCFHKQGPHMLAFNYERNGVNLDRNFAWCSADDLDTWTADVTNTAGSLLIREANSAINCVAQIGNNLAVYTETQMFLVSYVGLPNIFGYQSALENGVGAVSPNSVISVGRLNYGVTRDGFFVTDGTSVQMIGRESGMNTFFRDNVSTGELGQIYGYNNSKENEVVWAVPLNASSITKEIYYNYKTKQWSMRDSSISAYHERGLFRNSLSGDTGNFYFEGNKSDLANPSVVATTKAHDLNDASRIKEVSSVRVGKEGTGSPRVRVGWSNEIDDEPYWNESDSFFVDESFKKNDLRTAGRYIHLEISSDQSTDDWTITDMVVQGRFEGSR